MYFGNRKKASFIVEKDPDYIFGKNIITKI